MSKHEDLFAFQLKCNGITDFETQHRFHKVRRWTFDFSFPGKIAVEIDGGIWGKKSGHNTGTGILLKIEKMNAAQRLGWKVYTFSGDQVKNGQAINYIIDVLGESKP